MPRRRLSIRKIGEVLRLKAAGLNIRDIAVSTGIGKTTVYEYLARAEAAGIRCRRSWTKQRWRPSSSRQRRRTWSRAGLCRSGGKGTASSSGAGT